MILLIGLLAFREESLSEAPSAVGESFVEVDIFWGIGPEYVVSAFHGSNLRILTKLTHQLKPFDFLYMQSGS